MLRPYLSRLKAKVCAPMPPKLYWWLMGEFRAVPAVTSQYSSVKECLDSGERVVALLERVGAVVAEAETLHVGCGIGRIEKHLSRKVRKCWGVDVSASMVRKAQELVPEPNVEFICSDGRDLGRWRGGSIDLVYSFFVFQHMPREQFLTYIGESFRVLRKGGRFLFQLPVDEDGKVPDPPQGHPYLMRYYARASVKEALAQAGFTMSESRDAEGGPDNGERLTDNCLFLAIK